MADNTGATVANLRMRKLLVTAPPALAFEPPSHTFIQNTVIDVGINLADQCAEPGTGTFNWLLQIDTVKKTLTTGGAPLPKDPFGAGYCFVNATIEGLHVGSVTVPLTTNADGSYSSGVLDKLYVPIFVPPTQMNATSSVVVLPLSKASVKNITLSDNGNCIGHYNANNVTPSPNNAYGCVDTDDTACVRWTTAGSLGGFITLDDANDVDVPQEGKSLCLVLDQTAPIDTSNPAEQRCKTDSNGHALAMGNFCSTSNSPAEGGACADSFWLAATFAASAAKISATPNDPACMGEVISGGDAGEEEGGDAGTGGGDSGSAESGAPADAGGQ